MKPTPRLGDRVTVECPTHMSVGLICKLSRTAARISFDDGSAGTFPLSYVEIRNDLIRVKPGIYESTMRENKPIREVPNPAAIRANTSGKAVDIILVIVLFSLALLPVANALVKHLNKP